MWTDAEPKTILDHFNTFKPLVEINRDHRFVTQVSTLMCHVFDSSFHFVVLSFQDREAGTSSGWQWNRQ